MPNKVRFIREACILGAVCIVEPAFNPAYSFDGKFNEFGGLIFY
jgi:hypothetical protein